MFESENISLFNCSEEKNIMIYAFDKYKYIFLALLMFTLVLFQLIFTLDGSEVKRITSDHKVKFISEDFNIGGHKNPSSATGGIVTSSFVGMIRDLRLNGSAYNTAFDLFEEMWGKQFPGMCNLTMASCFLEPK